MTHNGPPAGVRAAMQLHQLANSLGVAAAVQAAAKLRVADALGDTPVPAEDLAATLGVDAQALHRLLRALACHGVFEQPRPGWYGHTELSRLLRADAPDTRLDMVLLAGAPWSWEVWPRLDDAVRTGKCVFAEIYGKDQFAYLAQDAPEAAELFNRAMTSGSILTGRAVADTLDIGGATTVADIGGGHGLVLRTLLERHDTLRGVLFDLPAVVSGADPALRDGGSLNNRCEILGGDCRLEVPVSADIYLLKHVLHLWDDDTAAGALRNIRAAARPGARIVVVEQLLDTSLDPRMSTMVDLLMLLNVGGRERTTEDFAALFRAAGLEFTGVTPTRTQVNLVMAAVPGGGGG